MNLVTGVFALAVDGWAHAVLLRSTQHAPGVVEIVGSEGKPIQISFVVRHGWAHWTRAYVLIGGRRVARIRLLRLLLQIALHERPDG